MVLIDLRPIFKLYCLRARPQNTETVNEINPCNIIAVEIMRSLPIIKLDKGKTKNKNKKQWTAFIDIVPQLFSDVYDCVNVNYYKVGWSRYRVYIYHQY